MIEIEDKSKCCGCGACAQVCPKHCITMTADNEGFLYSVVDKETCVDCGLCEWTCHELHPKEERRPIKVMAAMNKNEEIRLKSSSGGVFHLLAEKTIKEGGVVFGARFDAQWQVVIDYAETLDGILAFMGSKYVQARTESAYQQTKQFLKEGRQVLFSGTPCQVAGLHQYLHKPYENLLTVDFICHGTPSPKVWGRYLEEVVHKVGNVQKMDFRNKTRGWKNYNLHLTYNEKERTCSMLSPFRENPYMKVFLRNITLRPSCYACQAKSGRSGSDLTIADFWGIDNVLPEMDDDKGTSLVLIQTEKGLAFFDSLSIRTTESNYEAVKQFNHSYCNSVSVHPQRPMFFSKMDKSKSIVKLMERCIRPPLKYRILIKGSQVKGYILSLLRNINGGG